MVGAVRPVAHRAAVRRVLPRASCVATLAQHDARVVEVEALGSATATEISPPTVGSTSLTSLSNSTVVGYASSFSSPQSSSSKIS
eukprot:14583185-Heterocapsa_arctica.AAC.1